uniref:hypothetical protein n=1 Tax=Candidatus Phyllobacterium onerii TaxID=3020828 RepID=UPI00232ABA6E
IKIHPKICFPNLVAMNEKVTQRHFYFAETGHFNFALTPCYTSLLHKNGYGTTVLARSLDRQSHRVLEGRSDFGSAVIDKIFKHG